MANSWSNLWGPTEQLSTFQGAQLVSCGAAITGLLEMTTVIKQWQHYSWALGEVQQQ